MENTTPMSFAMSVRTCKALPLSLCQQRAPARVAIGYFDWGQKSHRKQAFDVNAVQVRLYLRNPTACCKRLHKRDQGPSH